MSGMNAFVTLTMPHAFTSITLRESFSPIHSMCPKVLKPALLTTPHSPVREKFQCSQKEVIITLDNIYLNFA